MTQVDPPCVIRIFTPPADAEAEEPKASNDNGAEDYFRMRERAERAAAKYASSSAARSCHQQLAQHYAELSRGEGRA